MPPKWMQAYMDQKYEEHRRRVKEAKSYIGRQKPPEMPYSARREMERKRVQANIELDNRLMMDRLAVAMSRKNIDNELHVKPFISYLELQRKKTMKKLVVENHLLLERIQHTVPTYNHEEWELDADKRVEYLRNMTEFPDYFVPPRGTRDLKKPSSASLKKSHELSQSPEPPVIPSRAESEKNVSRPFLPEIVRK